MNFGNLLFRQSNNIRKQVRNIKTHEMILIQAKMVVVFNNTCINVNLLPNFTNVIIYLYRFDSEKLQHTERENIK